MKLITSIGTTYIRWQYDACPLVIRVNGENKEVEQDCTSCTISNGNKEEVAKVTIKRHFKDPVNKILARKTTFRLAIQNFSKADKKLLWDEFLKNVKIK